MRRIFTILHIFILMCTNLYSEKLIHGTVTSAQTGKALPAANIQIIHTLRGTVTNDQGAYELRIERLPAEIKISYIGYESKRVQIDKNSQAQVNISLTPALIDFGEMVITAENPALAIMRKVIDRKQRWRKNLHTFRAEAYSRLRVENDTSIVFIIESNSTVFWDRERGPREVIKSSEKTLNLKHLGGAIGASRIPNFYDDDIEIGGHRFIGPTHPDALRHYQFKIEKRRAMDGQIVYDILLTPKDKLQTAFTGYVSVLDGAFALLEVDLQTGDAIPPQPFFQEMYFHLRQQFNNFGKDFWLPIDWREQASFKAGVTGLSFPTIKYQRFVSLDQYEINVPVPDSLYESKRIRRRAEALRDSLPPRVLRTVPLTLEESQAYASIDTSVTMERAFKPSGFLARFVKFDVRGSDDDDARRRSRPGDSTTVKAKKVRPAAAPQLWYNRVDGFHLGVKLSFKSSRIKWLQTHAAYNSAGKRWAYGVELAKPFGPGNRFNINAEYNNSSVPIAPSEFYPQIVAGILPLLGLMDYYDYYWNRSTAIAAELDLKRTKVSAFVRREEHSSLRKKTDFDLLGRNNLQRANPDIDVGTLGSVGLKLSLGERDITYGTIGLTGLTLEMEYATPRLFKSDFSFNRIGLEADWRLVTFLERRMFPNTLDVHISAAWHSGTMPLQKYGALHGSLGTFTPFATLRSIRTQPVYGADYLGIFWEHNFRTVPFELLGIHRLANTAVNILIHGASARMWNRQEITYIIPGYRTQTEYHELGISLSGLWTIFRIDLTRRLSDSAGWFIGIAASRIL